MLFEGALEALTRTKDSIGRATRQAMECAKFGITNEVVFLAASSLVLYAGYYSRAKMVMPSIFTGAFYNR